MVNGGWACVKVWHAVYWQRNPTVDFFASQNPLSSLLYSVVHPPFTINHPRFLFRRNRLWLHPRRRMRIRSAQRSFRSQVHEDRGGYKDGGIGSGDHPDEHGEGESLGYFTAYQEQDQDGEEYCQGGHDGPAQGFVNRLINDLALCFSAQQAAVFPDPVKYDHGIVHRKPDHRQDGSNKMLIYFQRKRYKTGEEGEYRQGNQNIMQQGENRSQRIPPVAETDKDINEDHQQGKNGGFYGPRFQVV